MDQQLSQAQVQSDTTSVLRRFLDQAGVVISTLCIFHCILAPVLLLALPVAGSVVRDEWFHRAMATLLVPVAAFAFIAGVRQHGSRKVLFLGALGVILITVGAIPEQESLASTVMTVAGSFSLVVAHLLNRRLCRLVCQIPDESGGCCYNAVKSQKRS